MSNRNTKDMPRIPIPVAKLNMLQRLRFASEYFFTLAEREREKGDRADSTFVREMLQCGALWPARPRRMITRSSWR
jgi:hypothetical protein